MRRGEAAEAILDQVQMLDQQIPSTWEIAKKGEHVLARLRIDPAALSA